MAAEQWGLNPDYDPFAALQKAVQDLMELDAEGCRLVQVIADAMIGFGNWKFREPTDDSRAQDSNPFAAFREVCHAMIADHDLAQQIAPLAEARQKYQAEVEADQDANRQEKRHRPRHRSATVLHLAPTPERDGPQPEPT